MTRPQPSRSDPGRLPPNGASGAIRPSWSGADDEAITRLMGEGRSFVEIAERLARTKNAVASRAWRIARLAAKQGLPAPWPEGRMFCSIRQGSLSPPATAFPSLRPSPAPSAWRSCQFPMWPHDADRNHPVYGLMCGQPSAPQRSYCAEHHSRCAIAIIATDDPEGALRSLLE